MIWKVLEKRVVYKTKSKIAAYKFISEVKKEGFDYELVGESEKRL
jgi:hypothetical protein